MQQALPVRLILKARHWTLTATGLVACGKHAGLLLWLIAALALGPGIAYAGSSLAARSPLVVEPSSATSGERLDGSADNSTASVPGTAADTRDAALRQAQDAAYYRPSAAPAGLPPGRREQRASLAPASPAFTATNSLTLQPGEDLLSAAVIDTANGFAYFGTDTDPAQVVKVRLSDFTRVGAITLDPGEKWLFSAVIDTANGFAYFGTNTAPGRVIKVRLSDFTRVSALTLNTGEDLLWSGVIDAANGYAYFGTASSPGQVVKVRLSDLTHAGALTLNAGEVQLWTGVIDAANGYAYFGTFTDPGRVVKVRLSDFTRVGAITLDPGEKYLFSAVIDTANDFAYFGTDTDPGQVVKVRLSNFTRVGALTLDPGENRIRAAAIDTAKGLAYFGTLTAPGIVVQVRLSDFTRTGTLTLGDGQNYLFSAVVDSANNFAYFGAGTYPGIVVKLNLGNLLLTKSASHATANAGDVLTYTLVVDNLAGSPAPGVVLTDTLPPGTAFVAATPGAPTCSPSGGRVICSLGSLAPGARAQVLIRASVVSTVTEVITNTAVVAGSAPPFNTPSVASASTRINGYANLALAKSAGATALAGSTLAYTLAVTNTGPAMATGLTLTDTLPLGVTFASASPGCVPSSGLVVCSLGSLPAGASNLVTVGVTIDLAAAGTITNTATVRAAEPDLNIANNTAAAGTLVAAVTDLALAKSAHFVSNSAGSILTYTLAISNLGPSPATAVTLTDTLPAGVTFLSASPGCAPGASGSQVVCSLGTLAGGAAVQAIIRVTITSTATEMLTNTATVMCQEFDLNMANNTAAVSTLVNAPRRLYLPLVSR